MNLCIYDPGRRHQYLSEMFFDPMVQYANRNGVRFHFPDSIGTISNHTVLINADHLTPDTISILRNNGNKIAGFSVTDSSHVSQVCRAGKDLQSIDLMFMLTGIQKINVGYEMVVDNEFNIRLEERQFLPAEDWEVFDAMRKSGRLKSLPYVHWERQPEVSIRPYNLRSQKVIIRGGNHMRRFIMALKLMEIDRLDINSGFFTSPYFQDDMNPQFRYCEECRRIWRRHRGYNYYDGHKGKECLNPFLKHERVDLSDLGAWNNKCPQSFFYAATQISTEVGGKELTRLLNARWLPQQEHLEMLARITFTSDLKWLFSIYAPQRFWDAAIAGCINLLPSRTNDQEFFPTMRDRQHYVTFKEDLSLLAGEIGLMFEDHYNHISSEARFLYDTWMRPTDYAINTNLLKHIFQSIEAIL